MEIKLATRLIWGDFFVAKRLFSLFLLLASFNNKPIVVCNQVTRHCKTFHLKRKMTESSTPFVWDTVTVLHYVLVVWYCFMVILSLFGQYIGYDYLGRKMKVCSLLNSLLL